MQKIRLDIGQNIQACRKAAGMTQDAAVAKMNLMGLSITKSTYAKIETNRINIWVSELAALAKIFNVEIGDFFKTL